MLRRTACGLKMAKDVMTPIAGRNENPRYPDWLENEGNKVEYEGSKFPKGRTLILDEKQFGGARAQMDRAMGSMQSRDDAAKDKMAWIQAEAQVTNQMKLWAEENAKRTEAKYAGMSPMRRAWTKFKHRMVMGDRYLHEDPEGSATFNDPANVERNGLDERRPPKAAQAQTPPNDGETKRDKWNL